MQWLIKLIAEKVIAEIGIPPCFIDRGDPTIWDYTKAHFTTDGAWHEFDLSAIVPAGAVAVLFLLRIQDDATDSYYCFRRNGNTRTYNCSRGGTWVANVFGYADHVCPLSSDRKIDYLFKNVVFTNIDFVVKGWWL